MSSYSGQGYNDHSGGYNAYGGYGSNMNSGMGQSGYMQNDHSGGGGGGGFSSNSQGEKKENYSQQTLRPVTIKQLLEIDVSNPDAPFVINGDEIKQVTLIAVVRNVNAQTTMTQYAVEDGTGSVDVKMWVNQESEDAEETNIPLLSYVKITGDFRLFGEKKHVLAHSIKPVSDHNEIAYHGLQTIYVNQYKQHKQQGSMQSYGANTYGVKSESSDAFAYKGSDGNYINKVYDYISSLKNNLEGVHIGEISSKLGFQITPEQVRSATNKLVDDGLIYTVMDEDHFLATSNSFVGI